MQFAELAPKGEMLLRRDVLVAEEDHEVFGERAVNLVHGPVGARVLGDEFADIDAGYLGADDRGELFNRDGLVGFGIVGDVRDSALGEDPKPMMYVPFAQAPFWGSDLVVNSTLSTASVAAAIRKDAMAIDKDLPVGDIAKMTDVLATNVAQPKFRTELLVLFAAMALILAATGIFGVISYSVSRRTREIGIRMALGAERSSVMWLVLKEVALMVGIGMFRINLNRLGQIGDRQRKVARVGAIIEIRLAALEPGDGICRVPAQDFRAVPYHPHRIVGLNAV